MTLLKCYKDEAEHWKDEYAFRMEGIDPENETGWEDTFNEEKKGFGEKRLAATNYVISKYDNDTDETITAIDYICEALDGCEQNESESFHPSPFTERGGDLDLQTWAIGKIVCEVTAHDWEGDIVGGYFYRGLFTSQELEPYLLGSIKVWLDRRK